MHVTSKLRQLIEQLFEIMQSEHTEFSVQQIVWAKVQQYPAWPAKIVRKLHQHGKTVYKLNFFGDPTYCYLHSHSLNRFSQFDLIGENLMEHDLKLKRAFELAKFYISKQLEKISFSNTQSSHLLTEALHPLNVFEQTKIQSKEVIDLPQKLHLNDYENNSCNVLKSFTITQVTPQNVLGVLADYHNAKNTSLLENLKRKQIICFQNDLKQNLLFKYKLNAVDFLKQTPKTNQIPSSPLREKRLIKKDKKKDVGPQFHYKQLCIRKVHKMLMRKGIQRHMASSVAVKLIEHVQNSQQSQKIMKGDFKFKQNMIKTLYELSSKMKQIQQVQMQYLQKQILSLIDMDSHTGHKMQQVLSRTTQMGDQQII